MDVFFVISGFLITSVIISTPNFSLLSFYDRRVRRIAPALIPVMIIGLFIAWNVFYFDELKQFAKHVWRSATFSLNYALIAEDGYFDTQSHLKPLLHLWSLSIEEQFYIIWPFLFLLFRRWGTSNMSIGIQLALIILIPSFILNLILTGENHQAAFFSTVARAWQLSVGACLALFTHKAKLKTRPLIAYLGLSMILISAVFYSDSMAYPGHYALLPTIGAALFIFANINKTIARPISEVGKISYPLYLWHWLILSCAFVYFFDRPSNLILMVCIGVSLLISAISHLTIEKLRWHSSKLVSPLLILSFVLVAIVGYTVSKSTVDNRPIFLAQQEALKDLVRTGARDADCAELVAKLTNEKPIVPYCRSSLADATSKVAIVGDSHAHTLFAGLSEQASAEGIGTLLLANSGCPPYLEYDWYNHRVSRSECQDQRQQIFKVLLSDKSIEFIVFSTRGPLYFEGEVKRPFSVENIMSARATAETSEFSDQYLYESISKTMATVSRVENFKNVIFLLENPEMDFEPRNVLRRPYDRFGFSAARSDVQRSFHDLRMGEYNKSITNLLKDSTIKIFDPADFLCDEESCAAYKDNKILYADDDHLSVSGSKLVSKELWQILRNR